PLHHFKLEPLVVFRHEKTPKGQIYVQLLGFSSRRRPFFWPARFGGRRRRCLGAASLRAGRRACRRARRWGGTGRR
ncbi:hypothetical protein, partial [Burkholderia pseudomallei]